MAEPTFSIVVPTHNYGNMIENAIASVTGQARDDVEILVVDDASSDDTAEVVSRFGRDVTYLRLEDNMGPALAWQYGLERATGEFVCKLDADDWQLPGYMDTVENAFRTSNTIGMVTGAVFIAREGEDLVHTRPIPAPAGLLTPEEFRWRLLNRFFFHMPTVATRRRALVGHLPIRADLRMPHDWEFFLRSMRGWGCFVLNEPLAVYRIHSGSLTRTGRRQALLRRDMERLVESTADPDDPGYLEPVERRRFAKAAATTYLRALGPTIAPSDVIGGLSEIWFAMRLAARDRPLNAASVARHAVSSVVTRGWRAYRHSRRRDGIPLTAVLPGGSMWVDDGSCDRSDGAPDSAAGG